MGAGEGGVGLSSSGGGSSRNVWFDPEVFTFRSPGDTGTCGRHQNPAAVPWKEKKKNKWGGEWAVGRRVGDLATFSPS